MHGTRKATKDKLFAQDRASRFAELVTRYCEECTDERPIPETVLSYVRRIAFFQCQLEDLEQSYCTSGGYPKERAEYARIAGMQSRLMRTIGLINSPANIDLDEGEDADDLALRSRRRRIRRERLTEEE